MRKPILLLQFRTDKSLEHEVEMIMEKGRFKRSDLSVINVLDFTARLPLAEDLDKYCAVVTAASGQYTLSSLPIRIKKRVEELYPFFNEIVKRDFPTLCICFGHHIFAYLNGGEVKNTQHEVGTVKVKLNANGRRSSLFRGIPDTFYVVAGHKDSVTKLPRYSKLLASSNVCKIQAYQMKNNIFSTQFHSELDLDGLVFRLAMYPEYLKGRSIDDVRKNYHEIPHATKILENFKKLIV